MNDPIETTGRIIYASREIEAVLRTLGASGTGLHERAESLKGRLNDNLLREIHWIASVRNHVAHETTDLGENFNLDNFNVTVQAVLRELRQLQDESTGVESETPNNQSFSSAKDDDVEYFSAPEKVELQELQGRVNVFLRLMAFIPVVDVVFFVGLTLGALSRGLSILSCLLFTLMALPMLWEGIKLGNGLLSGCGAFLILAGYAGCLYLQSHQRRREGRPAWFYSLPVVHVFYLLVSYLEAIAWQRLVVGALGGFFWVVAVILATNKFWWGMLCAFIVAYALSLLGTLSWSECWRSSKHSE